MSSTSPRKLGNGETIENSYTNLISSETHLSLDVERNNVSIADSGISRLQNGIIKIKTFVSNTHSASNPSVGGWKHSKDLNFWPLRACRHQRYRSERSDHGNNVYLNEQKVRIVENTFMGLRTESHSRALMQHQIFVAKDNTVQKNQFHRITTIRSEKPEKTF